MWSPTVGAVVRAAFVAGGVALALVVPAGTVSAGTTLHYYSKEASFSFLNAAGKKISAPTGPGDKFTASDLNYAGDHKKHAKKWTSTDHSICTIVSETDAVCDIQIAIGGSMLLSSSVKVTLSGSGKVTVPVNGGTGRYKNARGVLKSVQVGQSASDMTIELR
jgi:hypothetical protein